MINTELNTVKLDSDSGLKRQLRSSLPEEWMEAYRNGLLGEYDGSTIFYDVFLLDDCRTVVAIGPPLINLEKILLPATLHTGGFSAAFRTKINYKKLLVLSATLPDKLPADVTAEIKILFANGFTKTVRIHAPTPLQGNTVITIQKDNKIEWIKDWINYYRNQFDIRHVVVYDNNSNNQAELIADLSGIAFVIPWPFPFGITVGSGNKLCKVGGLNHFKIRYARNSLIFNFDIDELLVCKTEKAKRKILSSRNVRFDSFWVPYSSNTPENYSFLDFPGREAMARNEAHKYVIRSDVPGIMNVHYFHAWHGFLPKYFARGAIMPVKDAYFLHYKGITTNWKKHLFDRFSENTEALKNTVEDRSVVDAFHGHKGS